VVDPENAEQELIDKKARDGNLYSRNKKKV
jgi:hypothetical protein